MNSKIDSHLSYCVDKEYAYNMLKELNEVFMKMDVAA